MLKFGTVELELLTEDHLIHIWKHRFSVNIRKSFYGWMIPSISNQKKWFHKVDEDKTCQYFIAKNQAGKIIGVLNYSSLDIYSKISNVGWYFFDTHQSVGRLRLFAVMALINYLFEEVGLFKLYSDVLGSNKKALSFNKSIGFKLEGVREKHVVVGQNRIDLHLVGLFQTDYNMKLKKVLLRFSD